MSENAQHDDQVPSLQGTVADLATPEKHNCAFGLALDFTGRDTAAGKNWRAWAKHYQEKKATGESTDLHPDRID